MKSKKEAPAKAEKRTRSRFPLLPWIILVFVLPAAIYVTWVFGQLRETEARNLRILGQAAEKIGSSLQLARQNVESLEENFETLLGFEDRQPYLWLDPGRDEESIETMRELAALDQVVFVPESRPDVNVYTHFERRSQDVSLSVEVQLEEELAEELLDYVRKLLKALEAVHTEDESEKSELESLKGGLEGLESIAEWPDEQAGEPDRPGIGFYFRVDAVALLSQSAVTATFEHLLLTTGTGQVLAQTSLVRPFEERPSTYRVLEAGRLVLDQSGLTGGSGEDSTERLEPGDLQGASISQRVIIAGREHQLYCQPFPVEAWQEPEAGSAVAPTAATTWNVCGLVSPQRSLRQALAVAPHLAVGLVVFLILGVLGLPFAKLALMRRRERLRFSDAYLLLVVTFATLLVLPVFLLDADSYLGLRALARERLEALAEELDARLTQHVEELYDEVDRYDREVCKLAADEGMEAVKAIRDTGILRCPANRSLADPWEKLDWYKGDKRGQPSETALLPAAETSDFISVFWMDSTGMQIAKATVREDNTPAVDLAHRPYFQAIRDGTAWKADFGEFYWQTYASATTGERSTALSIRSRLTDFEGDCESPASDSAPGSTHVAAITSRPLWLLEPVLPPGIAFAIVDANGRSLFHSVGELALEENLLDELSGHRHLRSAMRARSATHFGGRYATRPHLGFVKPVRWAPWWIVTLADTEVAGTLNVEALGQTAIGAFGYTVVLNLLFLVLYCVTRKRGAAWLWPDREKEHLYRRAFWVSLATAVVFTVLILVLEGEQLQDAAFVMPVLGAAANLLLVLFWSTEPRDPGNEGDGGQSFWRHFRGQRGELDKGQLRWHLAVVVVAWLVGAVLPGLALFKVAWRDQVVTLVKLEGVELVEDLERSARWLEAEHRSTELPDEGGSSRSSRLGRRWRELSDLYRSASFFETEFAGETDAGAPEGDPLESLRLGTRLARFKPIYNPMAGGLRHLRHAASVDGRYEWRQSGDQVRMEAPLPPTLSVRSGWSDRPRIRTHLVSAIGGFLLLGALVLWVRWSALRIFFARIGSRVGESGYTLQGIDKIRRPVIALVPSPTDRRRLVTEGDRCVIDLGPDDHDKTHRQIDELEEAGERQVVCTNFGDGLSEPEERGWKLRQLEKLVYDKSRRLVLRTAASPLEDLFWAQLPNGDSEAKDDPAEERATIRLAAIEAQRWSRLLSNFVIYPVTAKPPELDAKDLKLLYETGMPAGAGRRQEALERRLELFEGYYWALWASCSADERLVLVQTAQENFVNPKQEPAVRRLLQKGLLKREPRLQLMDEPFTLFVRRIHEPFEIARWERSGQGLGWAQLRWAFFSLLAVVAVFLIATQQELVDMTLGFLSALAIGGLPGIIEVASRLRRSGGRSLSG